MLIGSSLLSAQSSQDPWENSIALKIARGEQTEVRPAQTKQAQQVNRLNHVAIITPDETFSGSDRQRRFYFEIAPTVMYARVSGTDTNEWRTSKETHTSYFYGVSVAFGLQFNKWNKLQFESGILYSNKFKCVETVTGSWGKDTYRETLSTTEFLCPTLITYNVRIPLGSPKVNLCIGPSIGGVEWLYFDREYKENDYDLYFTFGGNLSFNVTLSKKFYLQLGFRYLCINPTGGGFYGFR